jgi:hypothetical protein
VLIEGQTTAAPRPPIGIERTLYGLALSVIAGGAMLGASKVTILLAEHSGQLTATIAHDGTGAIDPTDDQDRVGAAGGDLVVTSGPSGVEYVASFP